MNELKEKSFASCKLWKEAGKPRSGSVFNRYRCENRVQPSAIAGSLNLNIVGLIVPSLQLVVFLMLML